MKSNKPHQAEHLDQHAPGGIHRRKFIKNAALGGTALLAGASFAGSGEEALAANVVGQNEKEGLVDIGELKSLKIKCLSETGWFNTSLLLEAIKDVLLVGKRFFEEVIDMFAADGVVGFKREFSWCSRCGSRAPMSRGEVGFSGGTRRHSTFVFATFSRGFSASAAPGNAARRRDSSPC